MTTAVSIPIEETSRTAEARRTAREMALDLGMDESGAEHVALVATEVCTNLLKHAGGGQILLQTSAEEASGPPSLELLAMDQGPGMSNLESCLRDGYSTASSPGQGLGAIQRMSQQSDFYTLPGKGTVVLARWWAHRNGWKAPRPIRLGGVNVSKPGEEVCGDAWGAAWNGESLAIVVADGLGHGLDAKLASREAVRQFHENVALPPNALLTRIHQALRSTRGAAVAIAQIDANRGKVTYVGLGNICARIYANGEGRQNLVSLNGTAGHQCERIQEFSYPWPQNGLLVMHSDGLATGTALDSYPGLAARDPALIAAVLYRDFFRGRDDATVVVAKAG
ncbi:MAG TPA: ATP-binding SpoIIE family protein phosphatase [Bryobacteraceae bacterium]|nr:ATP-binding SpoIIE family protein phosphatase [Bryobacteraceae bacterium]